MAGDLYLSFITLHF